MARHKCDVRATIKEVFVPTATADFFQTISNQLAPEAEMPDQPPPGGVR